MRGLFFGQSNDILRFVKTNRIICNNTLIPAYLKYSTQKNIPASTSVCPTLPILREQPTPDYAYFRPVNKPSLKEYFYLYKDLSKAKLSTLVVMTTLAGHLLAAPLTLSAYSLCSLAVTLSGTALCSFSANAFNQWIEVPFDAQMKRTSSRPLPRHALSPPHAFLFACTSGILGCGILTIISPISSFLALTTILLYAGVYTPLKRYSIGNTWIGAIVGAIPPLIGWTAASAASIATPLIGVSQSEPLNLHSFISYLLPVFPLESLILPAILFAWQFPHFHALSHNLRQDYAKAGYCMASVLAPRANTLVSLVFTALLFPVCLLATASGLTDQSFLFTSSFVNGGFLFYAWAFQHDTCRQTARKLFLASLLYLPILLALLFLHKSEKKDINKSQLQPIATTDSVDSI